MPQAPKADRYENTSRNPGDVAAKISSLIPRGARVLDVGCGTGSISAAIIEMTGAKLIGIEPDAERAKLAKARGLTVFTGLLNRGFLKEHGPFDVIVFADVLEHLPNPAEMVTLAKEGLVPKGAIVVSVPNVAHWFIRLDLLFGRFDYTDCGLMDATHLRWFTRKSMRTFFENTGFEVTAFDQTVNSYMNEYQKRLPWRWLSGPNRRRVVQFLSRKLPGLFGCQHVVRANLP